MSWVVSGIKLIYRRRFFFKQVNLKIKHICFHPNEIWVPLHPSSVPTWNPHMFCIGSVWAMYGQRTGHARVTHGPCTGSYGHRTVPQEWSYDCSEPLMPYAWARMPRTMPLRAPYRSRTVLLLAFAIPWSKYRRHTHGTRRKPVDHVTTNIVEG